MVNIQDFFKNQQGKSGTKRKAEETESPSAKRTKPTAMESKPKVIELDDDFEFDDDDDDDILEIEPPKKASPKKKQPEASSKKPQGKQSTTKKETKPQSSEPMGGESIDAVLAKIPDAELPEMNEGEKPNFFALKAQQNVTASTSVDLPAAQPNCLTGLTIVFTGQMPSLDRNTAESTAQQYGAKVTKSISKKTSLVVIGSDAGPSKVKKIKEFKIKAIDEAGFIQLLSSMPADGGSGEAAVKAKEKREQEERKIIEEAERAEKEEREEEERKRRRAQTTASQNVSNGTPQMPPATKDVPAKDRLWTDKHAPKDFNQLCGNKGQVQKLRNWLEHWFENKARNFSGGPENPGSYRAALISGPPGIGKTTAAHMVANSLGFDVLEKNASDVRSKSLLNANIKSVLSNTSVIGFFKHRDDEHQSSNSKKLCLIMDEVDGMSSGDHGGAGALSQFCRITNMPMILICNDKSLPKMRTFDRVTYDLPFRRPTENEVKSRLMTIALREGIKLDPNIIGQLVQATSNDIRQMINLLSTVSKTQKLIGTNNVKDIQASWKKQIILKPFDIAGRLLSSGLWSGPNQNLNEKLDLYFNDIDFAPLMIQENYLNTRPRLPGSHIKHVAQAADDISLSDSINSLIRSSEQQWSLLPFHGLMSTVKPSYEVAGQVTGRLNFSAWLGQNSKQMKYQRMLQELQYHTRVKTSTTKQELRLDYLNPLWIKLNIPIKQQGEAGIDQTIETMDAYYLTKEDYDNISDMLNKPIDLDKKDKTAFTRKYNNAIHPTVIYKTGNSFGAGSKRTTPAEVDYEDVVEDDMEDVEDDNDGEESDKIDAKKDKLIKQVPVGKGGAAKRSTKGSVRKRQRK
ncbi:Rfc1 protein [Candida orthopsilosis Co 90-125]|uniref:Replication factor C subunit 1 n=1 Tax=Candida orthopsilosis (strain 90-125) TaxID=1136231 RepID=H8WYE9_CANO9|nr:Rfc1 protein [Candida orthopsilosis Co 90-125]CCG21264.1 Rfc1 protein [Candida orthopsilosis Co 90-125]